MSVETHGGWNQVGTSLGKLFTLTILPTTPGGRLMRNILGSMAEYERELIRERVKAGLERARAKGVKLGRRRRVLDLDEIRRRRARGQGWKKIARALKVPSATLRRRFQGGQKPLDELRRPSLTLGGTSGAAEGGAET